MYRYRESFCLRIDGGTLRVAGDLLSTGNTVAVHNPSVFIDDLNAHRAAIPPGSNLHASARVLRIACVNTKEASHSVDLAGLDRNTSKRKLAIADNLTGL